MKIGLLKQARVPRGTLAFSLIYNEEWFLPHFLEHHRALGVEHFVFYDDHSTDRTREILMEQEDCTVLVAIEKQRAHRRLGVLQINLGNLALERFGSGSWAVTLDLDEFLMLPPGFSTIAEMGRYLEEQDQKCAMAAMVDFYPKRLSGRFFDPLPPLEGSPWFDPDPTFTRSPGMAHPEDVAAGVRARLLRKLWRRYPGKIEEIYGNLAYRVARMWKVPLLKTGEGIVRTNAHTVNARPTDQVQLGLAHFKFYPGLDKRVQDALKRQGYFGASVEYRFLQALLELFPDEPLTFPRSVKYRSPASLEEAGLIWAH